jgi:transglutaminase-like putative cysteine protease
MSTHLDSTDILDFHDPAIESLVASRGWTELPEPERIGAVYDFVRDEIGFGYNSTDVRPASGVLADGHGQCNTKTNLLMALLRSVGIACRFHGATIHKELQKGVVEGLLYRIAPENIFHSWTEVEFDGRWVGLEGVILDRAYLDGLRSTVAARGGAFLGYGAGTEDIDDPPIEWCGDDTAIQATGVNNDFGIFDDPDAFYAEHGVNVTGVKGLLFRGLIRHLMNRKVASIRACANPGVAAGARRTAVERVA